MRKNFVRRTMKRMAAIGTGVAMVGATMTGALALDLADYPEPFVMDGVYDDANAFVVGDSALAADTLGAVDIAANLQFESKTTVETEGTSVSVEGGKTEKVPIGKGLSNTTFFDTTLEDDDVSSFWDGEITFQGTSYDTSEQLELGTRTNPLIQSSLTSSDDEYTSSVFLEVTSKDVIRFSYMFDESINLSKTTTDDPLKIDFLGDTITVTSIDSATKFTAYVGEEHYLTVDESVSVDINGVTKTVTLQDVSSTSAVVDVDGVSEIITKAATETINGVEITVDDVFSRTERSESSANLVLGEDATEAYTDGDPYIGEPDVDYDWAWDLAGLNVQGTAMNFSVENDFVYDDDTDNPPGVGDCISLPNDYAEICFDSLTVSSDDYAEYLFDHEASVDLSEAVGSSNTSVNAIVLESTADEGFELSPYTTGDTHFSNVSSTQRAKKVWLYTPGTVDVRGNGSLSSTTDVSAKWLGVFYEDTNGQTKWFGDVNLNNSGNEIVRINYGNTKDTNMVLDSGPLGWSPISGSSGTNVTLSFDIIGDSTNDLADGVDDLDMYWGLKAANGTIESLGDTVSSEEAVELRWGAADTALGTKDEDHRTHYGIIIKDPKGSSSSDKVVLEVPQDQVMANIIIQGSSTTVSSGDASYTPQEVTPVTYLASEVSSSSSYNLIVMGGPCANDLAGDLFDMTCDGWSLAEGEAVLKLVENGDNVALLVAGTSADDTRRAAKALADYSSYSLSGAEVLVSGTSLTDVNIGTVDSSADADADADADAEADAEATE